MPKSHKLPDDLLATPALSERLFHESIFEGASGGYWHLRQRENGAFSRKPVGYVPPLAIMRMSEILLGRLNRELSAGGAWVVAWVNAGDKMVCLWMDGDGDVRFTYEADASQILHPVAAHRLDLDDIVNACFESWKLWKMAMVDVLDPRPGKDHYRRALGETPPSAGRSN